MKKLVLFLCALVVTCSAREIHGEVFVATKGDGSYRFGGVPVVILPLPAMDAIRVSAESEVETTKPLRKQGYPTDDAIRYEAWVRAVRNATALAITTTNANGEFSLSFDATKPVFLFSAAKRTVPRGGTEYNIWAVPIGLSDRIDLNQNNVRRVP